MNTALLSNITIESIAQRLAEKTGEAPYTANGYNTWIQELISPASGLAEFKPDLVFITLHGSSTVENSMAPREQLEELLAHIKTGMANYPEAFFVVSTLDIPARSIVPIAAKGQELNLMNLWKDALQEMNAGVLDLHELVTDMGRKSFYSPKMWYLGGLPFSNRGEEAIADEMSLMVKAIKGKKKKCLVLDLDNTLWGGVIGEDGMEGIELAPFKEGARYYDFQSRIKELKQQGVILAIVSKNNPDDALEPIRQHPHMVLREEDFVATKLNWNPKPSNIEELELELNIGLDSMVFIDDNPFERNSVRETLPTVVVPEFPKDTTKLEEFIRAIAKEHFLMPRVTEEDAKKTIMYQAETKRKEEKVKHTDLGSYLHSLNMELKLRKIEPEDVARAAQLTQKTNQFNLTTKRYTESDIKKMADSDNWQIWIGELTDRYGDYGKVALAIVEKEGDRARFDSLLMSCRVMGRKVENSIMNRLEEKLQAEGVKTIGGSFIPTKKNRPVETFWPDMGYGEIQKNTETGEQQFELELPGPQREDYA